jgi:hypothetical protein
MGCQYFMARFDAFKKVADAQVTPEKQKQAEGASYDDARSMEFNMLNQWMADEVSPTPLHVCARERAQRLSVDRRSRNVRATLCTVAKRNRRSS